MRAPAPRSSLMFSKGTTATFWTKEKSKSGWTKVVGSMGAQPRFTASNANSAPHFHGLVIVVLLMPAARVRR